MPTTRIPKPYTLKVRLTEQQLAKLQRMAEVKELSMAEIIRDWIQNYRLPKSDE